MPRNYGTAFWRVTAVGRLYSAERFSIALSMKGDPANLNQPTQAHADAAVAPFRTRLQPAMTGNAVLESVKIARIGADGLYGATNAVVATNPVSGSAGTGTGAVQAPQVSLAVTLRGTQPRGAAGNGRFYIPAPAVTPTADGRISQANAQTIADLMANLVNDLNAALPGEVAIVGPETTTGRAPAWQRVDSVRVGRVLDTVRSRRSSFPEEYVNSAVAIPGPFQGGGGSF